LRLVGRLLPLALGSVVVLLACANTAYADSPVLVANIISATGQPSTYQVTLDQLISTPGCTQSAQEGLDESVTTANNATVQEQIPSHAWNLGIALTCVPTATTPIASAIQSVFVTQSDGRLEKGNNSQLSPSDLGFSSAPSNFQDGLQPLVGQNSENSEVYYVRPDRVGVSDAAASDVVVEDAPLIVSVYEGARLGVSISASASSVPQGTAITFTSSVANADGSPLSYVWDFGDGTTYSGAEPPPHIFGAGGSYTVGLLVTDGAGGAGGSTTDVTISSPTPQTTTQPTKTTGPTHSRGKTPGAGAGKPTKSAGTGKPGTTKGAGKHHPTTKPKPKPKPKSKPKPKPKPSVTASTHKSSSAASAGPSGATPVTHTVTHTSTTGTAPGTQTGASSSSTVTPSTVTSSPPPAPSTTSKPAHQPTHKPRQPTHTAPPSRPKGTPVSGLLIGAITPATPAAISRLEAAAAGSKATAPPSRPPQSASSLGAIAAVAGVVLLLLLGAVRELGRRTRLI
jgi:PKD repeat protein